MKVANERALLEKIAELRDQLNHAICENFAFNVKVSREINELRMENAQLRDIVREVLGHWYNQDQPRYLELAKMFHVDR